MLSEKTASDGVSSSVGASGPSRSTLSSNRSKTSVSVLKKRTKALQIENNRLKYEKRVMCGEVEDPIYQKHFTDYKKLMDKELKILNKEFIALKDESVRIFIRGRGDVGIADRAQAHLAKVRNYFNRQLSQINSLDSSTWSQMEKTMLLEHWKKLFEENVSRMDEWINLIIDAK